MGFPMLSLLKLTYTNRLQRNNETTPTNHSYCICWTMQSRYIYQYLVIISANICTLAYGTAAGWTSAAFIILQSETTPLAHGPLSSSEMAWVGSLIGMGGVVGTLVIGWMCDRFGRKFAMLFNAIPMLVSLLRDKICMERFSYKSILYSTPD